LVEDLLLDEDYNMYLEKFHTKLVGNQFYYDVRDISQTGLGLHELLDF